MSVSPVESIPSAALLERSRIINLIQEVQQCWPDNNLVLAVLRSLVWEIEHFEEGN